MIFQEVVHSVWTVNADVGFSLGPTRTFGKRNRVFVRGQKIAKRMFESNCPPLEAIAHEERITASYATRLVRLAFLAPDIVAAILAGKQPAGLTGSKLMADTRLPLNWRDQRAALGFT
jgi:site-specific DNA recombinase